MIVLQGTHSPFGAFLDPVADKLMVSTVLILLCSQPIAGGVFAGNAWLIPTLSSGITPRPLLNHFLLLVWRN